MIALDDSQSMADPHIVHLGFQALALVTTALERLEVGQVSIAKFGSDVQFLHPFGAGPISGQVGGDLLQRFTFEQTKTDYANLLAASISEFERARAGQLGGTNADDLWQLQIIISDGMTSNNAQVQTLLRKATEGKVLVVFIILDAAHRKSSASSSSSSAVPTSDQSILNMTSVRWTANPQTGQSEIVQQRYLDSFPFDKYVVLRDANELPEMLSRLLKQFFEAVCLSQLYRLASRLSPGVPQVSRR